MKNDRKNPWCIAQCVKHYQVIVENLNESHILEESKEFRRFEDAKEYYFRMNSRKDRFIH